jgi:hypothetical protein
MTSPVRFRIKDFGTADNINYPKVEYPGHDFIKDTSIIRNLIFKIQQVSIMQIITGSKLNTHWL